LRLAAASSIAAPPSTPDAHQDAARLVAAPPIPH
jgi:hypothetical protein